MLVVPKQQFPLWPFLAGALGIGIFIFDSISPLEFAVAVLYMIVAPIAATSYQRLCILTTAGACVALTVLTEIPHMARFDTTQGYRSLAVSRCEAVHT
jgi:hypothetical protein